MSACQHEAGASHVGFGGWMPPVSCSHSPLIPCPGGFLGSGRHPVGSDLSFLCQLWGWAGSQRGAGLSPAPPGPGGCGVAALSGRGPADPVGIAQEGSGLSDERQAADVGC